MSSHRLLVVLSILCASLAQPLPASAVIILDETWADNGGSKEDWSAGFDLAEELAAEPQFASAVSMGGPDAEGPNWCSGTWLGNDADDHAYVLISAHCFQFEGGDEGHRIFRTDGGTERSEVTRTFHPRYDPNDGDGSGYYDMAVIELDGPIEDLGDAPVLYSGSDEVGQSSTQVGYGVRGTGHYGQDRKFNAGSAKAAVRNTIDPNPPFLANENGDTFLTTTLDRPGNAGGKPVDELQGIGASGDSGGPLWIETGDGWRIAGVYASSTTIENPQADEAYGKATSYFARVSTNLEFLQSVFPDVLTGE